MPKRFRSVYEPRGTVLAADINDLQAKFPIGSTDIATDAVTNPKVAPHALDGETITGSVFQTAASGSRIVMRDDSSAGVLEFWTGLGGETDPGTLNPDFSGGSPTVKLLTGKTSSFSQPSQLALRSGATLTDRSAYLYSGTITLEASNVVEVDGRFNLVPAGVVQQYAGSSAPDGFLLCNGAAVSRTTYASLFAVVGTTYGVGNGTTTFNLPNLNGADGLPHIIRT
jgi:hypothetical protein